MKSRNPTTLYTYLVFNQLFLWILPCLFLALVFLTAQQLAPMLYIDIGAYALGILLKLLFYLTDTEVFCKNLLRTILSAFFSPAFLGTSISRGALAVYLFDRLAFLNMPGLATAVWYKEQAQAYVKMVGLVCGLGTIILVVQLCLMVIGQFRIESKQKEDI